MSLYEGVRTRVKVDFQVNVGMHQGSVLSPVCHVWSAAQKTEKDQQIYVHAGFDQTRSVGYGKQCLLVWSCVEERGWSCLEMGIRF